MNLNKIVQVNFNLKKIVNPINSNFQSKWIWSIRMITKNSFSFGLIPIDRIRSDCKVELILIDRIIRITSFGLILNMGHGLIRIEN